MAGMKDIQLLKSVLSPIIDVCNLQSNGDSINLKASSLVTQLTIARNYFISLFGNVVKEGDNTILLADLGIPVTATLKALEDLLDEESIQMLNFTAVQYRKLYTISRKETYITHPNSLIPFSSELEAHKQNLVLVSTTLDALNRQLAKIAVKAPPEPASSGTEDGAGDFSLLDPFALRQYAFPAFNAIKSFCEECKSSGCNFEHFGLLFMRAYNKRLGPAFDLLLSLRKAGDPPWGECQVTPPASRQGDSILSPLANRTRCSRLDKRRLHANFEETEQSDAEEGTASFREVRTADPQRTNLRDATVATLRDILQTSDAPSWPIKVRIMLAFSIAFGTLALTNTPWQPGCLSIDVISFLQDSTFLYLEPCILSMFRFHNEFENPIEGSTHHDDPFRLALGIVLIELWTQETLESAQIKSDLQDSTTPSKNTRYDVAARVTISTDFSNHRYYEMAVRNCIQPRQWANHTSYDNEEYQTFLREEVFRNLFSEIKTLPDFNVQELENLLQHTNMPRVEAKPRRVKLFDRYFANLSDSTSDHFLSMMKTLCSQVLGIKEDNARRVKVAIIDTGIDYRHTLFYDKSGINGVRMIDGMHFTNCVNDNTRPGVSEMEACMDLDGHGTHIAGIFRNIEKIADIHVLKVANENILGDISSAAIAVKKAIDTAKGWEADIINMSFGFSGYHPSLEPVKTALESANSNGIIIFASSHNEGSSKSIPWPAIQEDLAIRISSADRYAKKSDFSPLPQPLEVNVSTLGENITSTYAKQSRVKRHTTMKTLSGASFATPLAACMAAVALYLIDNASLTTTQREGARILRTIQGMRQVLIDNFVEKKGKLTDGFSYISPLFFSQRARTLEDMITLINATLVEMRNQ